MFLSNQGLHRCSKTADISIFDTILAIFVPKTCQIRTLIKFSNRQFRQLVTIFLKKMIPGRKLCSLVDYSMLSWNLKIGRFPEEFISQNYFMLFSGKADRSGKFIS